MVSVIETEYSNIAIYERRRVAVEQIVVKYHVSPRAGPDLRVKFNQKCEK